MNILSMLERLQCSLGCADLVKQMVLIAPPHVAKNQVSKDVNLIVGYNGSPRSQTALDLTLWIAYQTRLATSASVTVQVVYAMDLYSECHTSPASKQPVNARASRRSPSYSRQVEAGVGTMGSSLRSPAGSAVAEPLDLTPSAITARLCQTDQFEQADQILWQARNLADEWRGSLETHLRFGSAPSELRHVVDAESGALLVLGCESASHPLVAQLGSHFPCAVLGIPPALEI